MFFRKVHPTPEEERRYKMEDRLLPILAAIAGVSLGGMFMSVFWILINGKLW